MDPDLAHLADVRVRVTGVDGVCEVPCSRLLLHLASPVFADLLREFPSDGVLPVANPRFAAGAIRDALALMHPRARAPEDPRVVALGALRPAPCWPVAFIQSFTATVASIEAVPNRWWPQAWPAAEPGRSFFSGTASWETPGRASNSIAQHWRTGSGVRRGTLGASICGETCRR